MSVQYFTITYTLRPTRILYFTETPWGRVNPFRNILSSRWSWGHDFTVTFHGLYLFLTNEEHLHKPNRFPIDVQATVDKPYIYILWQSKKSKDIYQLSYTKSRIEDVLKLYKPLQIHGMLWVFSGDGPARQFEDGQQKRGNLSCGIPTKEHQYRKRILPTIFRRSSLGL